MLKGLQIMIILPAQMGSLVDCDSISELIHSRSWHKINRHPQMIDQEMEM